MSGADRPNLRALADFAGILPQYEDAVTGEPRPTADATHEAILRAMGYDASTEQAARQTLEALARTRDVRLLEPVRVARVRRPTALAVTARCPAEPGTPAGPFSWHLTIRTEQGTTHTAEGTVAEPVSSPSLRIPCPEAVAFGYHAVELCFRSAARDWSAQQTLIIAPRRCHTVRQALGSRRSLGICSNLYTVRSAGNWGVGDVTDLTRLCEWCGSVGLDFVGVNPLHALRNRGWDVSPYSPVSRLYYNPIYLDIAAVPELNDSPAAQRLLAERGTIAKLAELRAADDIRYVEVLDLKERALRELYRIFAAQHLARDTTRGLAFAEFSTREGAQLHCFASFEALSRAMSSDDPRADWHAWPSEYRDPRSQAVLEFCQRRREEINYHKYVQFELDRQLGSVARAAACNGLQIGLYQDLALGSAGDGSDAWANPQLFVEGANLGAPPDDYSTAGQDWGFPPLHPHRLRDTAYHYWRAIVRRAMAHSGALRIDHAMGLLRQYWVPHGMSGAQGAYVRYPVDDLLGVLALESRRNKAIVIGEDLGTVPKGFSGLLARWGILSCRVVYFQRDERGDFVPSDRYPRRAVATVNTHDHPPLAGFISADDLRLRRDVGDIASDEYFDAALARREKERRALLARLIAEGLLGGDAAPSYHELCEAAHVFLARTPSRLIGLMLDDFSGERIPVNLPGVGMERFASWSRKMSRSLEEIMADPWVQRMIDEVRKSTGAGPCATS